MGRAHTDGDVVVFLPRERMIATGDMITSALSYTGDAFVEEWPATLEQVMTLDFDTVLPGHGNVFKGKGSHPEPAGVLARLLSAGDRAQKAGGAA